MALLEIIRIYLPAPLARITDSYLQAWIDVDRILFFCEGYVTYGGYTNHPRVDTTEYGLNRARLDKEQPCSEYNKESWYWQTDKFVVDLVDGQKKKHSPPVNNLYDLSRLPACAGINVIHFLYQHRTKQGLQIDLRSTCTLPEAQNYFSVYDIAKGISVFTEAICRLTESLSDQGGGQIDSFEILRYEGDALTVRIDFVNRCDA
jgi:hypothetical protein